MEKMNRLHIRLMLNSRELDSNKTNFGHAFLLAGTSGKMGSALLASRACLRSGVGLLTTCVPTSERIILQSGIPEGMVVFRENEIDLTKKTAIGIGPSMGTDEEAKKLLRNILVSSDLPMVIDADALTIISEDSSFWRLIPENAVLTPHQGEFDRLFGKHMIQDDRLITAKQKAVEHKCIFVMKGHHTVIVSPSEMIQNSTGNVGLAKGGSGDALMGIICAFLAQGYEPYIAAQLGVFFHGLAADMALEKQSQESLLATDMIEYLGKAFNKIHAS